MPKELLTVHERIIRDSGTSAIGNSSYFGSNIPGVNLFDAESTEGASEIPLIDTPWNLWMSEPIFALVEPIGA